MRTSVSITTLDRLPSQRARTIHVLTLDDFLDAAYRFWPKVRKSPDCWEWSAGRAQNGYGCFAIKRYPASAHRVAWVLANGPIPDGMFVCHRCDNPSCVRPAHLFLGTPKDNMVDRDSKGRHARGARDGQAKLTESQAHEIRARYSRGDVRKASLAREYGVCCSSIGNLLAGRTWAHVV